MCSPECFQCFLHVVNRWEILWFCYVVFCYLPARFDWIQFRWIWWNEFHTNPWVVFLQVVSNNVCLVKSCIVENEHVFFVSVECGYEVTEKVFECHAVLCFVEIIIEVAGARKSTKCNNFFIAPEECAPRCFSSRKPDALVCCRVMEACFIYCYDDMAQVPLLKFFLNSSRNSSTFCWSCLRCCGRGVMSENPSLCMILSIWRSE